MTKHEWDDIGERLALAYGQLFRPELVVALQRELGDRDGALIQEAVGAHIRDPARGKFPPTVADLNNQLSMIEARQRREKSHREYQERYEQETTAAGTDAMIRAGWREKVGPLTRQRDALTDHVRRALQLDFRRVDHRAKLQAVIRAWMKRNDLTLEQAAEVARGATAPAPAETTADLFPDDAPQ